MNAIYETNLSLPKFAKGKVRDTYELGTNLLMVSTDRLSAFDVVFNEPIPHKGEVLNLLSAFWFGKTRHIIENHLISTNIPSELPSYLDKRGMIVKRAKPVKLECVVRGYLTGSALKEYKKSQSVCGIRLPEGLKDGSQFPEPIFTPSTKAEQGHDENITPERASEIIGKDVYETVKQKSVELYEFGREHAKKRGLILVDTKFEFGADESGNIILIDEAMTPDSSRYWIKEEYDQGILESLDKQFVRNYLEKTGWNKSPPPPPLPPDVIEKTTERYLQAYKMLTGKEIG